MALLLPMNKVPQTQFTDNTHTIDWFMQEYFIGQRISIKERGLSVSCLATVIDILDKEHILIEYEDQISPKRTEKVHVLHDHPRITILDFTQKPLQSEHNNGTANGYAHHQSSYGQSTTMTSGYATVHPHRRLSVAELRQVRLIQKNCVYVEGLSNTNCNFETLTSKTWFGQFGQIRDILIHSSADSIACDSRSFIVVYDSESSAEIAMDCINNSVLLTEGRKLKAIHPYTYYCEYWLRSGSACLDTSCQRMHRWCRSDEIMTDEMLSAFQQNHYFGPQTATTSMSPSTSPEMMHPNATPPDHAYLQPLPQTLSQQQVSFVLQAQKQQQRGMMPLQYNEPPRKQQQRAQSQQTCMHMHHHQAVQPVLSGQCTHCDGCVQCQQKMQYIAYLMQQIEIAEVQNSRVDAMISKNENKNGRLDSRSRSKHHSAFALQRKYKHSELDENALKLQQRDGIKVLTRKRVKKRPSATHSAYVYGHYLEWTHRDIFKWIMSVQHGWFRKYGGELYRNLKVHKIDGRGLRKLTQQDLYRLGIRGDDVGMLFRKIQQLIQS
eukprot:CAMPEP_0197074318 /NCGR_PEP_ID=MMETSP1384-20130603/211047_1 /TAXON_ID=29189 /ORGANISM="Ammonia sp." /LENGTH=549 /DNA_ID=CAMNT_0042513159 /DNA_START=23 /DNA_END=1672 /DNA_ORIENTATION=+